MSDRLTAVQINGSQGNDLVDSQKLLNIIDSYSHETLKSTKRILEYCNLSENAAL